MTWVLLIAFTVMCWFAWSLRHLFDYTGESLVVQILGGMLYDLYLLGCVIRDTAMGLLGVLLFPLIPLLMLGEWVYGKWNERAR